MNKFPDLVFGGTQECGRLGPEDIECDIYLSLSELVACRSSEVPSADRQIGGDWKDILHTHYIPNDNHSTRKELSSPISPEMLWG